jgi:flagellar hook assembly protein FlgD
VSIKVYTVAGRLIHTFHEGQRSSGYNESQPWQGKDQDGDDIANGVYLYKVIARAEGKRAEAYGKVVVMR